MLILPVIFREGVELLLAELLDRDETLRFSRDPLRPLLPGPTASMVVTVEVVVVVYVEGEDTLELVEMRAQVTNLVIALPHLRLQLTYARLLD